MAERPAAVALNPTMAEVYALRGEVQLLQNTLALVEQALGEIVLLNRDANIGAGHSTWEIARGAINLIQGGEG